jgi:hypothetical protein
VTEEGEHMELIIDDALFAELGDDCITGIYVRAKQGKKWHSVDIAVLQPASLLAWLRRDGEQNCLAENVIGIILGHGHIA